MYSPTNTAYKGRGGGGSLNRGTHKPPCRIKKKTIARVGTGPPRSQQLVLFPAVRPCARASSAPPLSAPHPERHVLDAPLALRGWEGKGWG